MFPVSDVSLCCCLSWQFRFVSLHSADCTVESIQKALAAEYNFNVRRAFVHQVLWRVNVISQVDKEYLEEEASSAYKT